MDRAAELGKALAQMRGLWGLSIEQCASRAGQSVDTIEAAESGDIEAGALDGLARLYALDLDALREGTVLPMEASTNATVFLLHGAYTDFDARDLGVLGRAMRAARAMTALSAAMGEGEPLRRRLQFTPIAPAGPRSRDAARQGYKLARMVRERLGLGGEPLGDMRALLEENLGIAVLLDDLVSRDLRAASILDAYRAAGAAVLAAHHPDLERNPALARVYLAHELGHLLFDPGEPGSIRLVLDNHSHSTPGSRHAALLESRAKGFAAELLIPSAGLEALFGAPLEPESSLGGAREMVGKVRDRFSTPWEIACRHLGNLGFIREELFLDLLETPTPPAASRILTTLPEAAAMPRLLERLRSNPSGQAISASDLAGPSAAVPRSVPWYVDGSRRAGADAVDDLNAQTLAAALEAVSHGHEIEAADLLVDRLDALLLAGEIDGARRALARIDPSRLPPKVLSSVLMISAHAREELGESRLTLLDRSRVALSETWHLEPATIESLFRRLA